MRTIYRHNAIVGGIPAAGLVPNGPPFDGPPAYSRAQAAVEREAARRRARILRDADRYCYDERHGCPCPLPCTACADECDPSTYRLAANRQERIGNGATDKKETTP